MIITNSLFDALLWVLQLFKSLASYLCQPQLERLCLLAWDRLDQAEELLRGSHVGEVFFAIR